MKSGYILPRNLKEGDKIGIISPSFPNAKWFPRKLNYALQATAKHFGLQYVLAKHVKKTKGFVSDDAKNIANEIHEFAKDPAIKAIFTTIGGFNSAEILPYLDFSLLQRNPKIYIGYSDTTSLLLGINALSKIVTYYGPAIMTQFGEFPKPFEFTLESLNKTLFHNNQAKIIPDSSFWTNEFIDWGGKEWHERPRKKHMNINRQTWKVGKGQGVLFGGNIETINFLLGTKYFQPPREIIFFWEATEAEAFLPRIQRAINHLKMSGFFNNVKAMLIGRSPDCKDFKGVTLKDVVTKSLKEYHFPIISNLPFGHTDPMVTLPIGVKAKIIARKKNEHSIISIIGNTTKSS